MTSITIIDIYKYLCYHEEWMIALVAIKNIQSPASVRD